MVIKYPRTQVDGQNEAVSDATGLGPPEGGWEPGARQEFLADTDINVLLTRHGAISAFGERFGEEDTNADLLTVLEAARKAREAFLRLPEDARKFGSWVDLLMAVDQGAYPPKAAEAPAVPAVSPVTAPPA